jgi:hypothetical protein
MRIAYVTIDEVNQDLAVRMADRFGADVSGVVPKDPPPDGRFDAVLYDLDAMSPTLRRQFVAVLRSSRPSRPVGVHGYNLEDDEANALRMRGVYVSGSLEPALIQDLCRAVEADRAASTVTEVPDAEVQVVLVD